MRRTDDNAVICIYYKSYLWSLVEQKEMLNIIEHFNRLQTHRTTKAGFVEVYHLAIKILDRIFLGSVTNANWIRTASQLSYHINLRNLSRIVWRGRYDSIGRKMSITVKIINFIATSCSIGGRSLKFASNMECVCVLLWRCSTIRPSHAENNQTQTFSLQSISIEIDRMSFWGRNCQTLSKGK